MKKYYFLIITVILISCQSKGQDHKITIPKQVKVENLSEKIEVKGTRILIDKPEDYKYYPSTNRFQKSENNYFQIIDIPGQNYNKAIPGIINKLESQKQQGGEVRFMEKFKLGSYNAFIGCGPQGETEQLIMSFGDDSFSALFISVYPNNYETRKKITDLALSLYVNKNTKVDLSKNLHYSLDLKNSKFKLSTVNSNAGIYTLNGKTLTTENSIQDYFFVNTMPVPNNFDLKQFADRITDKLKDNKFENQKITKFEIESQDKSLKGENKEIKILINAKLENKDFKMYAYFKETPKGIIQFFGVDFESDSKRIEEYKSITNKIILK
jgi:hypothetical protein